MIKETVNLVKAVSAAVESLRTKMDELAAQLPEYHEVMTMYGAGKSTGPQLMAEIGDIRRFADKKLWLPSAGLIPERMIPAKRTPAVSEPANAVRQRYGKPCLSS